jgi:hypothetical protein
MSWLSRLLGALIVPALLLPGGWRIDLCLFARCMPESAEVDTCCQEPVEPQQQDCCQERLLETSGCGERGGQEPCAGCSVVHRDPTVGASGHAAFVLPALILSAHWTPFFGMPRGLSGHCDPFGLGPPGPPGASANLPLRI